MFFMGVDGYAIPEFKPSVVAMAVRILMRTCITSFQVLLCFMFFRF
ncbi:hypothetical protein HMPREF1870_00534 [Bacteroidales bacterium KA00344]|nr:hypothetical protein HMPREF1870_00534 [Bacteroidales bacterium KA00344]